MRAVNLVPQEARRGRGAGGRSGPMVSADGLAPAYFAVALLAIVVALVLLRVLADNNVKNKQATLAAVQSQVATEQAVAAKLAVYISFVQAAQQREAQIRAIAEQRFPWKRSLDQISHVLPRSTSLTSLSATTIASTTTGSSASTGSGPTFTLAGCADTPNQNGVATLLRRLTALSDVANVGFQNSTRESACGNNFNVVVTYAGPGASTTAGGGSTSAVPSTSTTTTTTTTTTGTSTTTPGTTAG